MQNIFQHASAGNSSSTCTVKTGGENETYAPNPFENTGQIKFYHNNVPRFGNTNDILYLIHGNSHQQQGYIQGLIASPIALFVSIIIWIIFLWIVKCCRCCCCKGQDWLTGKPTELPAPPGNDEEIDLEIPNGLVERKAFKKYKGTKTGVRLGQNSQGYLIVLHVDKNGLFDWKLQIGQQILSIEYEPPDENEGDAGGDHDSTVASIVRETFQNIKVQTGFIAKKIQDTTKQYIETMKSKTNRGDATDHHQTDDGEYNIVEESMRILEESVGVLTILAHRDVRKEGIQYAEWKNECDRVLRQQRRFKAIVVFALFALFICGIVLCSAGVNGLDSAINTGLETLDIVEGKMKEGVAYLDDALRLSKSINSDVNSLLQSLNGICPAVTSQICSNLNDPGTCQSIRGLSIVPQMQQAISYIQEDSTHEKLVEDSRSALNDIITQINGVDTDMESINGLLSGALAFGIIVIFMSIGLLLIMLVPMTGTIKSALFCCSYGLIFVIILFSFLLSLAFLPVSSVVADVCYNDPGTKIESILRDSTQLSSSDQIKDVVFNIFNSCSAPDSRLDENLNFQTEGLNLFGGFDGALDQLNQNAMLCRTSSSAIAEVETTLNGGINVHLCEALNILREFSDFFTCRFWHPIYAQAAHDSLCYQGMDALAAITTTLFVILCMSLIILTFRVALRDALWSSSRDAIADDKVAMEEMTDETDIGKEWSDERSSSEVLYPTDVGIAKMKGEKDKANERHDVPQEGEDENEETTNDFQTPHEWRVKGLEDSGEPHDEHSDVNAVESLPLKKKGPKKKKKKKRKIKHLQNEAEGGYNDEMENESLLEDSGEPRDDRTDVNVVDGPPPNKKKGKKKKKKKNHLRNEEEGGDNDEMENESLLEDSGELRDDRTDINIVDGLPPKKRKGKKKKKKKHLHHEGEGGDNDEIESEYREDNNEHKLKGKKKKRKKKKREKKKRKDSSSKFEAALGALDDMPERN